MGLFLGWSGLIVLVMVVPMPGDQLTWIQNLDALVHLGLFLILGGLFSRSSENNKDFFASGLAVTGLLLIGPESLQAIVPTRSFSLIDLFFNLSGVSAGFLLASSYTTPLYALTGSILLAGPFLTSQLSSQLFDVVFARVPDGVVIGVPLLILFSTVLLVADFSRSLYRRAIVVGGGVSYLLILRSTNTGFGRSAIGILFLGLLAGHFLDKHSILPHSIVGPVNKLLFILYVSAGLSTTVSQRFFLSYAGPVLGIGILAGILGLRLIHRKSYRHYLSPSPPDQS
ncbi:MAG: hypothetical protein ABEK50_14435 [bacterium]